MSLKLAAAACFCSAFVLKPAVMVTHPMSQAHQCLLRVQPCVARPTPSLASWQGWHACCKRGLAGSCTCTESQPRCIICKKTLSSIATQWVLRMGWFSGGHSVQPVFVPSVDYTKPPTDATQLHTHSHTVTYLLLFRLVPASTAALSSTASSSWVTNRQAYGSPTNTMHVLREEQP